jgi:tetratricopeptide (TPR) repeat protein
MSRFSNKFIFIFLAGLLLGGCASTGNFAKGEKHLENGEYDLAIEAFETARDENPEHIPVKRELGIAHYKKADIEKAFPLLLEAFLADSADGRTLFYLGAAFETRGDIPHAMDIYRRYTEAESGHGMRKAVEARLAGLIRKQMAEDAKTALLKENTINPALIPDSTLAVLYFRNLGKNRDLDPIQKGLADMLITDLSKVARLQVVERVRMQKLLDEMGLGETGLVGETARPRLGRLLGASNLVHGTFMDVPQDNFRIDAGFVKTVKGKVPAPNQVQGRLDRLFRMEKDLVFGILSRLGITPTQAERDEIEIIPTENLLAFLAYCNGLDYEDKGQYQKAREQYQRAARLDPRYEPAEQACSRMDGLILSVIPLDRLEELYAEGASETEAAEAAETQTQETGERQEENQQAGLEQPREESQEETTAREEPPQETVRMPDEPGTTVSLVDQILHTAEVLDQGFLPGIDTRKPTQEENQSSFGNAASFEIHVPLPQQ